MLAERLEKEVKKIAVHKSYSTRIRVRKGDDIKPLADALNELLDTVEKK